MRPGPSLGVGEHAVLAGPVVPDGVDPDDLAVPGQLDEPGHDGHVDGLAGLSAASLVIGADEADHAGAVGQRGHDQRGGGIAGPPCHRGSRRPVGLILPDPLRMGGDHDASVHDVDQAADRHDLDRLPGLGRAGLASEPGPVRRPGR